MNYNLSDVILGIFEIITLLIGLIVFTGVFAITKNYISFIFLFLDYYCCICFFKAIQDFIIIIKTLVKVNSKVNNVIDF